MTATTELCLLEYCEQSRILTETYVLNFEKGLPEDE